MDNNEDRCCPEPVTRANRSHNLTILAKKSAGRVRRFHIFGQPDGSGMPVFCDASEAVCSLDAPAALRARMRKRAAEFGRRNDLFEIVFVANVLAERYN